MPAKIDLTGQIFNRWTVIEEDLSHPGQGARWICQCSCPAHTIRSVKGQSLRNGHSKSCGCLQKEIAAFSKIKMIGEKFGKLTVLKQDDIIHPDEAYWICQCECGTVTQPIRGSSLRNGHTISCGCVSSKGEEKIAQFLFQNEISFIREFKFKDLFMNREQDQLRFDFAIFKNKQLFLLIEYQGKQHYQDDGGYMGGENFQKIIKRDQKKKEYCKANNYKLLEISYKDYANIETILKEKIIDGYNKV